MTECDECGKGTDKQFYITFNLPDDPNDTDVSHFKKFEKWVCKDCNVEYHNMFKKIVRSAREMNAKIQRGRYEDEGDIKDLR